MKVIFEYAVFAGISAGVKVSSGHESCAEAETCGLQGKEEKEEDGEGRVPGESVEQVVELFEVKALEVLTHAV